MKQGARDVTDYYMEIRTLWQELDLSFEEEWECVGHRVQYEQRLKSERILVFG